MPYIVMYYELIFLIVDTLGFPRCFHSLALRGPMKIHHLWGHVCEQSVNKSQSPVGSVRNSEILQNETVNSFDMSSWRDSSRTDSLF